MLIEPPPPTLPPSNGIYLHEQFKRRHRLRLARTPTLSDLMGGLLVLLVIAGCVFALAAAAFGALWLLSESLGFLVRRIGG